MHIAKTYKAAAFCAGILAATLLTSCGGGSAEPAADASLPSGVFIDSAVAGLTYVSGTTTGTTDSTGRFEYQTGETVTFSIGGVTLGTVNPKGVITPVDLVPGATDETNATVTNIARFLQTIDDDGDPSNGITISAAAAAAAAGSNVNFSQTTAAFEGDGDVTAAVTAITTATAAGVRPLVTEAAAKAHLQANLIARLAGTYAGTYTGDSSGTFNVTVNSAGNVSGVGVENGLSFAITGTVASNGTGSFSGNAGAATFSASINPDTGAITGTWQWVGVPGGGTLSGQK